MVPRFVHLKIVQIPSEWKFTTERVFSVESKRYTRRVSAHSCSLASPPSDPVKSQAEKFPSLPTLDSYGQKDARHSHTGTPSFGRKHMGTTHQCRGTFWRRCGESGFAGAESHLPQQASSSSANPSFSEVTKDCLNSTKIFQKTNEQQMRHFCKKFRQQHEIIKDVVT